MLSAFMTLITFGSKKRTECHFMAKIFLATMELKAGNTIRFIISDVSYIADSTHHKLCLK